MRVPQVIVVVLALLLSSSALAADGPGPADGRARTSAPTIHDVAPPAAMGPVKLSHDRVILSLGVDEDAVAPDDDPLSPRYERRSGAPATRFTSRPMNGSAIAAFGPNIRINTLLGTPVGNAEAEVSMAAMGQRMVSAWNDGQYWTVQPGFVGWGYSNNGGVSWTDGGGLPVAMATDVYYGDPVVASDPSGHWYIADLYEPTPGLFGISVNHGTFSGSVPAWDPPVTIATSSADYLDKPWIAVDPADGTVYLTFVRFYGTGGQDIEFSKSINHGVTWSPPVSLTSSGLIATMSPRPVVGPSGELYVAYYTYDYSDGQEYLRIQRSLDHGVSFGPESNIGDRPYFNNYYSGPAGYNRERVVALVSLAVDRSSGPTRGRLHAVWHEMRNVYADALGTDGNIGELEPNETQATATPLTLGQAAFSNLSSTADQDWYSFSGVAGQTVILELVRNGSLCDGYLRMFAGGGAVANRCAFSHFSLGFGQVIFTLPSSGTYYVRVANWDGIPADVGNYVLYTGTHSPDLLDIARDQRDILASHSSDGGMTWSPPVLVNDDSPRFDNTWPEVAVDGSGGVHVIWYDHRLDGANGILTDMGYASSADGGISFSPSTLFNDGGSVNWNNVATNIYPNMGDYSALVSDGTAVYANWADGRGGTPDAFFAALVPYTAGAPLPVGAGAAFALRALGESVDGRVRVRFTVPTAGDARIDLLDVAGRRRAALYLPGLEAGQHDIDVAAGLPAGVYFVRARQRNQEVVARAVALR